LDATIDTLLASLLQIPATGITEDLAMKDVDAWDSLKHMELIASLEQNFGIELSFEEIVAMQNVREIKRVLKQRGVTA
jgi:acyl carrier protein